MTRLVQNKKNIMTPRPSCFCCKSPLDVCRNQGDNNLLYFDKHLYHKDCFIDMNKIKKKCYFCSQDIDVDENECEIVYYDKHYYHKNCFIQWCHATKTPSRKRIMALANLEKYLDEGKQNTLSLLEKKHISKSNIEQFSKNAEKYILQWFDESDLCAFLREEYDTGTLPWTKIKKVINGTDDRLDTPIPAIELLDMWQRKIDYIRRANQKLISKSDREISPTALILYGLSILINKYDS